MTLLRPETIDTAPLIAGIRAWVELETPSDRPDLIDILLDKVEADFEGLPVRRHRFPSGDRGGQLLLRYAPKGASGSPITAICHVDTVWDAGTLARRPVRIAGGRLHGPGVFDMKAGSYLATETLRRIAAEDLCPPRPLQVLLTSDEEIGSDASRALIEEQAAASALVLVPEPSFGPDIAVVTARKGWGRFTMRAHGVSAHAGGNLADGHSAIREIARQILEIEALTDHATGLSFNFGVVRGGTRPNVVPAEAEALIDMRAATAAQGAEATAKLLTRASHDPGVTLEVEGGMNRAPYERSPAVQRLYEATRALAGSLGMALGETSRGGVSDGNLAAAIGVPVLDGLGCGGAGAHAEHEHITLNTVAPRAALMRAMMISAPFQAAALPKG